MTHPSRSTTPHSAHWQSTLDRIGRASAGAAKDRVQVAFAQPQQTKVFYELNLRESRFRDNLVIDFYGRSSEGIRPLEVDDRSLAKLERPEDRAALQLLLGNHAEDRTRARLDRGARYSRSVVRPGMYSAVLSALSSTGRFVREAGLDRPGEHLPIEYDEDGAYHFALRVSRAVQQRPDQEAVAGWQLWGELVRDDALIELQPPSLMLSSGLILLGPRLLHVELRDTFDWISRLSRQGPLSIPFEAQDEFLLHLASLPDLPDIELPPELHWSKTVVSPRPKVAFAADESPDAKLVLGKVSFDYGGEFIEVNSSRMVVADEQGRRLFRRDIDAEHRALRRLAALGLRPTDAHEATLGEVKIPSKDMVAVVRQLVEEGWQIEADGEPIRAANGQMKSTVSTNLDWFDLEALVDFDGREVALPELLEAAQTGEAFVTLSDGSKGLVPDWLGKYATMAKAGTIEEGKLRFLPSQAAIIDALLFGQEDVEADVEFDRVRKNLKRCATQQVVEPEGFAGTLRDYQREGLGWLRFLEACEYGGCLADDMGLGKTVQVLSMLQGRHRPEGREAGVSPSLIVVPKSLIYNWINEAKKFTPDLRAVDYTGAERLKHRANLKDYDLIVTTYGTLRQDVLHLVEHNFETVILDEAQAIKNPRSQAAKACRLLRSKHRLAISGTPVENSLQELWSIFEFLNPGILGDLADFAAAGREKDEDWLAMLSRSLAPLMLRRTKEQVLKELPQKTELTLHVELKGEEREAYDELRDYYRGRLSHKIEADGLAQSKIQVLEALLRLRQASCHPGLIDPSQVDAPSAKIDLLLERLEEAARGGHKVLVFSQFTTLLDIVRRRLIKAKLGHQYLDGQTNDRGAVVRAFQTDPESKVFLISLKAGGCGLNLTQSDYVFILDPWWNPAIEAQAVDRAHRMGQKRPVFAYRLITMDTVEEKIAKLQDEKRRLADAVVSENGNLLKDLSVSDLNKLFS